MLVMCWYDRITHGASFDPAISGVLAGTKKVSITITRYVIIMPLAIARHAPSDRSSHRRKIFLDNRLIPQPIRLHRISMTAKINAKLIKGRYSVEGREGLKRSVNQGCKRLPIKIPRIIPASEQISLIIPRIIP